MQRRLSLVLVTTTAIAMGVVGAASAVAADGSTGSGHGTWKVRPGKPDTGTTRVVAGSGHFSGGAATFKGTVTAPGLVASGVCSVKVRVVTASGSFTLSGHGKRSSHPTCIGPFQFPFSAKSYYPSGDFDGTIFLGEATIDLENASTAVTDHGTVKLTLSKPQ